MWKINYIQWNVHNIRNQITTHLKDPEVDKEVVVGENAAKEQTEVRENNSEIDNGMVNKIE